MPNLSGTNKRIENLQKLAALSGVRNAAKFADIATFSKNQKFGSSLESFFTKMAAISNLDLEPAFLPGPRPEDLPENGLILGSLPQYIGSLVRHPIQHTDAGILISGRSGSGKSFLVSEICEQLLTDSDSQVKVLIFDSKGEYQNLLAKHIRSGKLWILDYKQYRRNLLQVLDKEEPLEAINRIVDLLWSNSIYLRHGTTNLIADLIKDMYTEKGIFEGSRNYPTLLDLHQKLVKMHFRATSRYSGYQESGISRVKNLINQMNATLDCVHGHNIQQILNNNIILRVRGLSDVLFKIIVEDLLRCILQTRSSCAVEGIKNLIIVDEAHLLLSGSSSIQEKGEDFLLRFARLCRSSGCDLLLSDQTPSLMQSAVMANMSTRIAMQIVNGPCVRRMAESMSLTQDQAQVLPRLKPRQAVMHFTGYPDSAFLIQIPELDFNNKISDEEINQIMSPILSRLEWIPNLAGSTEENSSQIRPDNPLLLTEGLDKPAELAAAPITKEEIDYLIAIAENPFIPVTRLDRSRKISLYKGHQLRKKLGNRAYIQAHKIRTGKKGNPLSILEITESGWSFLESIKARAQKYKGVGGFIHCYWQSIIKEWYERKYRNSKAIIEDKTFGKAVDIGVYIGNRKTAVEILISGEQKEIKNITEDLKSYDLVMCCAEDWESLNRLKERVLREVDKDIYERVWFKLLRDFLVMEDNASPSHSSGSATDDK